MATQKPRQCFYIPASAYVEGRGFVPSLVTENEPGHCPMTGNGECAEPWYWGDTYERAQEVCDRVNLDRYGLTPKAATRIVASSMAAGRV